MSISNDSLYLYNLTLKGPTQSVGCIAGNFTGNKKAQELVLASCSVLEVWKTDNESGKLERLNQQQAFATIQRIEKIRVVGSRKDFLVVTSDVGKLVVLEYNIDKRQFIPLWQEPYSKTGFRRNSPGKYVSVDPQNRAICIASIERNKLIYKVSSNDQGLLELSSPLESLSRQTLTLAMCALDTGFENPVFAAIECEYGKFDHTDNGQVFEPESSPLILNFYELDQGLNHIVKRPSNQSLPASANHLIPLPSPIGGVIICCDSYMIYEAIEGDNLMLPIPKRKGIGNTRIINHVLHRLKKNNFFILMQSELGDCFKLTVVYDDHKELIENIKIQYFDTIPLSESLVVLKSGFLFASVMNDNKLYYQFEKLGDDDERIALNSSDFSSYSRTDIEKVNATFQATGLENLALVDFIETLNPIMDCALIESAAKDTPDPLMQLATLSSHSYLKILTHGIRTSIIVSSELPFQPTSVQTTKLFSDSINDDYLVISSSLSFQTLVLSIGEVVEVVEDSSLITDQPTLTVQQVGKSAIIQICPNGIRHVRHHMENGQCVKKATNWYPPAGISITRASTNNEQVVIGLANREVCYFEIDSLDDQLIEYQERLEMSGGSISAIAIDSLFVGTSQRKSPFAIVGCSDETLHVVSLKPHNCLQILTLQALSSNCSSIVMQPNGNHSHVHIGLENGLYVRSTIDETSGKLSDTRVKFLGSKAVSLTSIRLSNFNQNCILAISSRPWVGYHFKDDLKLTPLINTNLINGSSFYSEDIGGEGVVGVWGNDLLIFTIGTAGDEKSGQAYHDDISTSGIKLRYLPRRMVVDTNEGTRSTSKVYVIESEFGVKSPYKGDEVGLEDNEIEEDKEKEEQVLDEEYYDVFGYEKNESSWASCIQAIELVKDEVFQTIEFKNNECAISICKVRFDSRQTDESYLVVGTTKDLVFSPKSSSTSYLYTFKINDAKEVSKQKREQEGRLEFIHKTEIDHQPLSMINFNGMLLVGMDKYLRMYDIGKRQLLRKSSSYLQTSTGIMKIVDQENDRIAIGDANMSVSFVKFDRNKNQFVNFADDIMKRQITALTTLDHDTVIGGDKFGNIFVSRLPESTSTLSDKDWGLGRYQEPYLNGASNRQTNLCEFYVQDIPTSFYKGTLVLGGKESIFYTGIQGTIGMLSPLASKQEVEFLCKLEVQLRKYFDYNFDDFDKEKMGYNMLGMDHLKFRSTYNPVKNVIDGDLIERFHEVNQTMKIKIAGELDRSPNEVQKKIAELRHRTAF